MQHGSEPVDDDELILRRIPDAQVERSSSPRPSPIAFQPHRENDRRGISFSRAKYSTAEQVARGGLRRPARFVAQFSVRALRASGVDVEPDPTPDNPGHCVAPALRSDTRGTNRTLELQRLLAEV
jgi:hypothetical protein